MFRVGFENFRCFRKRQSVRLTPLTLLVGENSTGKTSFMAMVRALRTALMDGTTPDFKEDPYDLGSFEDIANQRGGRAGRAREFQLEIEAERRKGSGKETGSLNLTFTDAAGLFLPARWRLANDTCSMDLELKKGKAFDMELTTGRGSWKSRKSIGMPDFSSLRILLHAIHDPDYFDMPRDSIRDVHDLFGLARGFVDEQPCASAPVRSAPKRTYDPGRPYWDPEGDSIPTYYADLLFRDRGKWEKLKHALEQFGKDSGLFDEISIKTLGNRESEPFQIQIRKSGGKAKGPFRNLIDVGYGVSQALPVVTALLRESAPNMFLIQQPEVHLHPSAQASLASLFCDLASSGRNLLVETHSDYIIDRTRMEVRDDRCGIGPEDVTILYFERDDLDVVVHSMALDSQGNLLDAPKAYREFFRKETQRLFGIR